MSHILTTALIIVLTGAIAAGQLQQPAPEAERHVERLLLLPFEQLDPEPQHAWIAQAVHRTLLVDLAELPAIVPVTLPADEAAQLDRLDRQALAEAAASADARLILSGTYQIAAEQIRMTATLLDITREEPVAAMRATAEMHELFELQDALGEHVRLLLHEFDPALVEQDRLPVPVYPPAVEYRPPHAPVREPYYEPPPTYVYAPTYIPYHFPPRVHCPIWHPAPFRTTTFFFVVKSKPKHRIHRHHGHTPDAVDVVAEVPPRPSDPHVTHERRPHRPGRPIDSRPTVTAPEPASIPPRLTTNPPDVIMDSPQPPSDGRFRQERQARRPGRTIEPPTPNIQETEPGRIITIPQRPAPEPAAIRPPLQPPPERTITIPERPSQPPQRPRSITIPPRSAPERTQAIQTPPPPQPDRTTTTVRRLTPNPPAVIMDSPRPPAQDRTAQQRQPAPPPRVAGPPARTTASPPRLAPQPSPVVADSPRPPAQARTAPARPAAAPAQTAEQQPQAASESPPRGPAGRRR